MTTLKEEEPFAIAAHRGILDNICSNCFAYDDVFNKCTGCREVYYCNRDCQKKDWGNHKNECRLLCAQNRAIDEVPDANVRLVARILFKSEASLGQKAFNDRTWNSIEDHVDNVKGEIASEFVDVVHNIYTFVKPLKNVNPEDCALAYSKVLTNGFPVYDSKDGVNQVGIGLYLGLSVHKHSCVPDSQMIFTGTKASLRSFDPDAVYSEERTISYMGLPPWVPHRKEIFRQTYLYDCKCPICTDDNHLVNRMGSSCYVSCCEDAAGIQDETSTGPYKCNKCGKDSTITVNEVKQAENKLEEHSSIIKYGVLVDYYDDAAMRKTMKIIKASEKVLSVYNFTYLAACCYTQKVAMGNDFTVELKYVQDKENKALNYYYSEADRRKAVYYMDRSCMKLLLGQADDFDLNVALRSVVMCFGEDHPVTVKFKGFIRRDDLLGHSISAAMRNTTHLTPAGIQG